MYGRREGEEEEEEEEEEEDLPLFLEGAEQRRYVSYCNSRTTTMTGDAISKEANLQSH